MDKKHLRILSIDDDPDYQAATARFFAVAGRHMLFSAETGRAGLHKAMEIKPDLILLDLQLPDMSGAEVIRELHANSTTRDIPVIIISGSKLNHAEHSGLVSSPNLLALEEKPFRMGELLSRIEAVLLGRACDEGAEPA